MSGKERGLWMEQRGSIHMLQRKRQVVQHPCLLKRVINNLPSMGMLQINSLLTFFFMKLKKLSFSPF